VSDAVGARVKEYRLRLGLTREQVAERCRKIGSDITASVLVNIETGRRDKKTGVRRRDVTIDEVLALAYVLDVPPLILIAGDDYLAPVRVTPDLQIGWSYGMTWVTGEEEPYWVRGRETPHVDDVEPLDPERHRRWEETVSQFAESRTIKTYVMRMRQLQRRRDKRSYMDFLREMARVSDLRAMAGKGVPFYDRKILDTMLEQDWLEHPDEVVAAFEQKMRAEREREERERSRLDGES
jgi:transcriptional regulator with XRE-family HTH domain